MAACLSGRLSPSSFVCGPKLVRLLEVGLIINFKFPTFREAFEPAAVQWDVDPSAFIQRASDASPQGMFSLELAQHLVSIGIVVVVFVLRFGRGIRPVLVCVCVSESTKVNAIV